MLTVKDGESQVLPIWLDIPPDKLHKTVAPDVRLVQVVVERFYSLLSIPRHTFLHTVRSHFLCDENSVPTAQDFLLLD
ncbi:unnamed protein product, partial [Coregonus sp. 'balchen']